MAGSLATTSPYAFMGLGFLLSSVMSGAMFVGWVNAWLPPGGRQGRRPEEPLSRDPEREPSGLPTTPAMDVGPPVARPRPSAPVAPTPDRDAAVAPEAQPPSPVETSSPAAPDPEAELQSPVEASPASPEPEAEPEPNSDAPPEPERPAAPPSKTASLEVVEKALETKPAEKAPRRSMSKAPLPPDDLTVIKGIGAKLSAMLADRGITRFDQIAAWSRDDIKQVEGAMKFPGRVRREQWVEQAKAFSRGNSHKGKTQKPKRS